jgi:hypothetical protein
LFSQVTVNWRGRPLGSHEVIVNLIADTRTETGLQVQAELDGNPYPIGIKVTDEELAAVNVRPAKFHGEWNYTIRPITRIHRKA